MLDGRILDTNSKENIHRLVGATLVRLKVNFTLIFFIIDIS